MNGEKLLKWRTAKGLSQAGVARLLRVTTTTVYRWEHNIHPIHERIVDFIKLLPAGTIAQQRRKKKEPS